MASPSSQLHSAALALVRKGFDVFPCLPRAKEPATAHGCKDATTNLHKVDTWWAAQPASNVAIATGVTVFVVDIDGPDAEAELRRLEVDHGSLPATAEVITPRGRHLYFRMPAVPVRNSAGKIAPGIDVRGVGGYVLAPPSIHPSGKAYAWSVDSAPRIVAAPDWLLAKVTEKTNGDGKVAATPPEQWQALVEAGVDEGARDNSAARLAGYLLRRYVDPFVVLGLMRLWNDARCRPPLPAEDIERIVGSIHAKEQRRHGHV